MNERFEDTDPIIELDQLTKRFGNKDVINSCSLKLYPNHVYGLVGRSGAGKSTLLRTLTGIYLPTTGTCTILGQTPPKLSDEVLGKIGYIDQEDALIGSFSGNHFLNFVHSHYPKWDSDLVHEMIRDLDIPLDTDVRRISPGERQCLAFAATLAHQPDILIMDEPASALDPFRRERFLHYLLRHINTEGRVTIISSHLLGDLDRVVDQLIVLHDHSIICNAALDQVKSTFIRVVVWSNEIDFIPEKFSEDIVAIDTHGSSSSIVTTPAGAKNIREFAHACNWQLQEQPITLEEAFQYIANPNHSKIVSSASKELL